MIDQEMEERIHQLEKDAMTGDRSAVLELIDMRRKIHAALETAWDRRYRDGALDGVAASELFDDVTEACKLSDED